MIGRREFLIMAGCIPSFSKLASGSEIVETEESKLVEFGVMNRNRRIYPKGLLESEFMRVYSTRAYLVDKSTGKCMNFPECLLDETWNPGILIKVK